MALEEYIQIETVNNSGDLLSMFLGGVAPTNKVVTFGDLEDPEVITTIYEYQKITDFTVPTDAYIEVARLVTDVVAGTYEFKMAWTFNLNSASASSFFRFSINGGVDWTEFVSEPSDATNDIPVSYFFPIALGIEEVDFIFQARKEVSGDVLIIHFLDLIIDQKN